jgi:hypothetical protein
MVFPGEEAAMPKFRDKEEYERWKAQRQQELREKGQGPSAPEDPEIKEPRDPKKAAGKDSIPPRRETVAAGGKVAEIGDLFRNTWDVYKRRIGVLLTMVSPESICLLAVIAPDAVCRRQWFSRAK